MAGISSIKEEPLRVKHILWLIGLVKALLILGVSFVTWWISVSIDDAVEGLQTKKDFIIWEEKRFDPLVRDLNKANINIGIILDRTSAVRDNHLGRPEDFITPKQ